MGIAITAILLSVGTTLALARFGYALYGPAVNGPYGPLSEKVASRLEGLPLNPGTIWYALNVATGLMILWLAAYLVRPTTLREGVILLGTLIFCVASTLFLFM